MLLPLSKWCILSFFLIFVIHLSLLEANPAEEIFNTVASCLKHNRLGYDLPKLPSCSLGDSNQVSEACVQEISSWLQSKEEGYINILRSKKGKILADNLEEEKMGDILDSNQVTLMINEVLNSHISSRKNKFACPNNCNSSVVNILQKLKVPFEIVNSIQSFLCKSKSFSVETCLESVELSLENFLDRDNKRTEKLHRSTALRICYNIGLIFGRNPLFLGHIFDLIAFDHSIQEQLGVSISQLTGKSFKKLSLEPEIIYIFDSIRQIKIKEIYQMENNNQIMNPEITDSSRSKIDVLDADFTKIEDQPRDYSYDECQFGSDLLLKLYLIPMQKSEFLCKLFFLYRGLTLPEGSNYSIQIPELGDSRKTLKTQIESSLMNFGVKKETMLRLSRFKLFSCIESLLDKKLKLEISVVSGICYFIYRKVNKDMVELFDINTASYVSLALVWLSRNANFDFFPNMSSSEKAIYTTNFGRSVTYFLLQAMNDGFDINECRRHLQVLNSHEPFISQRYHSTPEFPFVRVMNPSPINQDHVNLICNDKSIIFQMFSKLNPFREFNPTTQPTMISFKNTSSGENSKGTQKNTSGTKEIFDTTLQLCFAGDVPRGYLMNAVSFSIVGLKAFLRNTLTFLSQEAIMSKYNDIQSGKVIVTPFSDVLSIMGISGSYSSLLNTQEQLMFTNKYICSGYSENIDVRIKNNNIVKYVGSPFYIIAKDSSTSSSNMFNFMNCVDEFILINWSNFRYSLLKSDPIMFCSLIGIYLARDYTYIQSEINKYAIYVTYYEITGNILPNKCMEVNFSSIPYIKEIEDDTILSKAFIDCIERYSTLTDFISKDELKSLSKIFSINVLEHVDKPMALHRSSTFRRLLTYILENYPKIGKDKASKIILSLNPIYGFNYDQLFSKLAENNIPFKESAIITGFVANQLDGNTKKLDFDFINWLRDYSGYYLPFENHPGLKENVLKLFTEQEVLDKSDCIKKVNELFDKFQVPLDANTDLICDEWGTLFENYPRRKSYNKFLKIIDQNTESTTETQKDIINLRITRTHPVGISTKVSIGFKNVPLISIIPILANRGLLDPKKEVFKGFRTESKTFMFADQENEMDISAETLGLNDGDVLNLILKDLEPEVFTINISWKDTNTRKEGSFLFSIKDKPLRQFLEDLYKREELKDRIIKFLLFPNGKMLDPQSGNLDQNISKYGFETSNKLELITLLKNISLLNLRLIWRNPSILEIIPPIDEKENLKENFLSKEIQISSNEITKNLFSEIKTALMDEIFVIGDKFGVDKFEVASIEILGDSQKSNALLLDHVENLIQNNPEKHNMLISDLGINDHDQILVNLIIEPFKSVNIVSKAQKWSYIAKITSIPYNFHNGFQSQFQFGLFHILNMILDNNIDLYDIIVHEKYFTDKKEAKNSKGHYINISPRIKTFNPVEMLIQNSLILLNSKKLVKSEWISLIVILKDTPDINKVIKFRTVMTSNKISDLLRKTFGNHIRPESLFTKNGKEIKLTENNVNIIFSDISLKDHDVLYLTCIKSSFDVVDMKEASNISGGISFERVEELLSSYGYIIQNYRKAREGIFDNGEISEYPRRFNDLPHLEIFLRQFTPSINSERLISESQEYIFQPNYRFPSALERLVPLLTEDFLGQPVNYNLINELHEKHGLLSAKEGDLFDFLACIRSFRSFFFYNRPKNVVYSARIYNICKRMGSALFRRESWLMEQGISGVVVSTLEEELLHPINVEKDGLFFNSVSLLGFLGSECIETLKNVLEKLYLSSSRVRDLEIPIMVNFDQVCMQIQSFVNNYDDSTGEYEKIVQTLPAYRLSQIIDSLFPKFWEQSTFGALLPNISEVKYAITPLFDFFKVFKFIRNHLEIHLKLLKDYPSCVILLTALLIRNTMVSSSISPFVFVRKLAQFALEKEYEETKKLNMNLSQILPILEKNPYLSSTNSKYETGDSWIWDTIKGNQNMEILDLENKLKHSSKLLLIFKKPENLCPLSTASEEPIIKMGDDIQALIKFFTQSIIESKAGRKREKRGILEDFKISDLALISDNLDQFKADSFYKIIKQDIMDIIKKNTKEMKNTIGYVDIGNYDHEYVPFIVSFIVISNLSRNKKNKNDLMYDFFKFFIQEIFLSLGIIVGNIEVKQITEKVLEHFDWTRMSVSRDKLLSILVEVTPINSATFIDAEKTQAIREISDLIVDILESKDPIKVSGLKSFTKSNNLDLGLTPRAHFYRSIEKSKSMVDENSVEAINKILLEKEGYPENLLKSFNSHLRESVKILNNEVIHVGRLGKMKLSPRQEHIGAIFLSYGYSNLQTSSFLNNFDHIHCFSSVLNIITDEPKRLDHYYQICMSVCIEVDEIGYLSCEKLLIQSLVSTLLSDEWPQPLKRLVSFLKYDYIFDHDLKILREIYLDETNKRLSEKWIDLIRSMKYSSNLYSIINQFKPYIDQILAEKDIKEPSSGFGLIDLIGELTSCWTRETGEDYIKKFLINHEYPIELLKPFLNIWPGDGRNRINLKVALPGKVTLKRLKASLYHEIEIKGIEKQKDSESLIDEMIEKITQSVLGVNIGLVEKIPNSMHKLSNIKMAENGVNIESLISKLDKNGAISIYLSLNECISETNKQIVNNLELSYSDILSFCVGIVSEISYRKMSNLNELNQNFLLPKSVNIRNELYFVIVFYGFQFALNRIFQGFLSKNKIKEYLLLMKDNLYQLNNELGILNFITRFVMKFRLPIDPNVLSYYLKEVILNFNSGISLDKTDEIKIYQNVPDIVISNKGFHKLVFEITKELFDHVGDELEEKHFKLLFEESDLKELIERGFNPINIQEFVNKITNKSHRNVLFEFGKKLGMNSLSFKLVYIHKMLQSKILEILKDKDISKSQRQFFTIISSDLSPMDKLIYEMVYTSRENCVVEMIRRYTTTIKQNNYGPHFDYAFKLCDELLTIMENMTQEIDNAFGLDYFGGVGNCDRVRINEDIEQLKLDISIILNYLNNFALITSLFEIRETKDLKLEKSIRYVEKKIESKSNRPKILRMFNKWDEPINKKILLEIKIRKNIFNAILSYLDNHLFVVVPMFRKISDLFKKNMDIISYQKVKKTLSKLVLTLSTVKNPYSVPSIMKNNYKITAEYLREVNNHKAKISSQESKDIHIFGISLLPYYLKISWYAYYLSTIAKETNVLLNQLPNFKVSKINKSKKKPKINISNSFIKSRRNSKKENLKLISPSKMPTTNSGDNNDLNLEKKTKGLNFFKRINRYFKKRLKSKKV
ncbi:very large secreted protein [Cryptosporidium ubiquitum]|uniref:Very large secreted protein n=1 Tax=Cryptosporidium ubiquitum TaxID=857276 RepID=A0A1J4MPT3_9CRYT|nr:very large secreted protein [Cryptosporidium ubiquitum]OII74996.1 very large secreted protein [Cryptosporidium ubiquitum]